MSLEEILLVFILFVLFGLFARIEAVYAASREKATKLRFKHYVQGLANALGLTVLFVFLVPLAVIRWVRSRRRSSLDE